MTKKISIGINAVNINNGGGVSHLVDLIGSLNDFSVHFNQIIIWARRETLDSIPNNSWLIKEEPLSKRANIFDYIYWEFFRLSKDAKSMNCDILLIPGGIYFGLFKPAVLISQNLLPFELNELKRYGFSIVSLKLLFLRLVQSLSFKRSSGLIFLTDYARNTIEKTIGQGLNRTIIPHGIHQFNFVEGINRNYKAKKIITIIYVSRLEPYKHQWIVIEALSKVRQLSGLDLQLCLVGPSSKKSFKKFEFAIRKFDPDKKWVKYHGSIARNDLSNLYKKADIGLFASSCENMPIILLEKMSFGLPILCSNRGPMIEVAGDAAIYFDPEKIDDITNVVMNALSDPKLISAMSLKSLKRASNYSMKKTSFDTLNFLIKTYELSKHFKK
jgi:glycosyltransferase involved in cell wall biosynthesis